MNIGIVSTRLAGLDGVSLEAEKWAIVLKRMGHRVFYCAGEFSTDGPPGLLVPEMHFRHPAIQRITGRFFGQEPCDRTELRGEIAKLAGFLKGKLGEFIRTFKIELLVVENALAIPMNIPLGVALTEFIAESQIPTIAHHHDFAWERRRYDACAIPEILEECFPPVLPSVRHVVINSLARRDIKARKGVDAALIPNVFDFAAPPPEPVMSKGEFRQLIGLEEGDVFFLQPTRVIPRKGIELAIELVRRLGDPRIRLVITHPAGDEGMEYLERLRREAQRQGVDLRYVADEVRHTFKEQRTLWTAYIYADFVTYPSLWEGFGNALLEAVYFRKPMLVNRYPVYVADIAPKGFRFVEIDGAVTDEAVGAVRRLLEDEQEREEVTEWNFRLGRRYYSLEVLEESLNKLL